MNIFFIHGLKASPTAGFITELEKQAQIEATKLAYLAEKTWEENWTNLKKQSHAANEQSIFIGVSMGGFFAAQLACSYGAKCYLANPVILPALQLGGFLGPLEAGGRHVELTKQALYSYLAAPDPRLAHMQNKIGLMLSSNDTVLDYEQALTYYKDYTNFIDIVEDIHPIADLKNITQMAKRLIDFK